MYLHEVVTQVLIPALNQDTDYWVRISAAQALCQLEVSSPEVEGGLLKNLQHDEFLVRGQMAKVLGQLECSSPNVKSSLIELLRDPNYTVRNQTVHALGQIGSSSHDVMDGVIQTLRDPNYNVSCTAVYTLYRLGLSNEAIRALTAISYNGEGMVRQFAASALRLLHPSLLNLIDIETAVSQDNNHFDARLRAAESLARLGHLSDNVIQWSD